MVNRRVLIETKEGCSNLAEYRYWILGRTQREIAVRSKTATSRISDIERGVIVPHPRTWVALAKAYQLPIEEFKRLLSGGISHGTKRERVRDAEVIPGASASDDPARSSSGSGLSAGVDQAGGTGASTADVASNGTAESVPA